MSALFESVVDVWVVWAVTLLLLTWLTRKVLGNFRLARVRRFHGEESGASYALPYMLTFPIFILIMACFIQATLILMAKIGTVYAAHSACRTYIVWQSAGQGASVPIIGDFDYPKYKAKRAATMAMVPFASSFEQHRTNLYPTFPIDVGAVFGDGDGIMPSTAANLLTYVDREAYLRMYRRTLANANKEEQGAGTFTSDIILNRKQGSTDQYIKNKYLYAAAATRVYTPEDMVKWNGDLEVKVKYRMPFLIPGTARFLGGTRYALYEWFGLGGTFYRDIESTAKMPAEAAKTDDGKVGIPYQPSLFVEIFS